ncbi:TPA: hypothetical protein ACRN02_005781 [Pseudomonas aeruginosa]
MAISAAHLSGLPGPVSAETYVFRLLMDRAISKLDRTEVESVLRTASRALANAGKWTDDVRITVNTKRAFQAGRQCVRMLHGVPSPRMWVGQAKNFPEMAAKDAIYFFEPIEANRRDLLLGAIPEFSGAEALADWLFSFSSTRFEKQLVQALVGHLASPLFKRWASQSESLAYRQIALLGAEIDRLAWFTGQRSMTLANAAPVWRP